LLTLREEYRLRLSENRVLRSIHLKIHGPKREEVRGGWRKMHNEELHNLYSKMRVRWVRNVICILVMRNAYTILVRKSMYTHSFYIYIHFIPMMDYVKEEPLQ
jgi:hypothetical protein